MNVQVYTTEEEQLQFLINYLKKHGIKIASVILLVLAIILGRQYWEGYNNNYLTAASGVFTKMQSAVDEKEQNNFANELVKNYKSTIYGQIATMHLANQLVAQQKWQAAAEQYKSVYINSTSWTDFQIVALENWIRAQIELKQYESALSNLNAVDKNLIKLYPLNFYNLKGDILFAQHKNTEAVAAYNQALDSVSNNPQIAAQLTQFTNWITLKRNDALPAKPL